MTVTVHFTWEEVIITVSFAFPWCSCVCWPFVFQPLKMFESFAKLIIDFLELPIYPKINPLLDAEFENVSAIPWVCSVLCQWFPLLSKNFLVWHSHFVTYVSGFLSEKRLLYQCLVAFTLYFLLEIWWFQFSCLALWLIMCWFLCRIREGSSFKLLYMEIQTAWYCVQRGCPL